MLHAADAAGEVLDAQRLADASPAVRVGGEQAEIGGRCLLDVDWLERAVEIARVAGFAVRVCPLRSERPGSSAD